METSWRKCVTSDRLWNPPLWPGPLVSLLRLFTIVYYSWTLSPLLTTGPVPTLSAPATFQLLLMAIATVTAAAKQSDCRHYFLPSLPHMPLWLVERSPPLLSPAAILLLQLLPLLSLLLWICKGPFPDTIPASVTHRGWSLAAAPTLTAAATTNHCFWVYY